MTRHLPVLLAIVAALVPIRAGAQSGVTGHWIDPTTGARTPLERAGDTARSEITPPPANAAGDEDWVLTLGG